MTPPFPNERRQITTLRTERRLGQALLTSLKNTLDSGSPLPPDFFENLISAHEILIRSYSDPLAAEACAPRVAAAMPMHEAAADAERGTGDATPRRMDVTIPEPPTEPRDMPRADAGTADVITWLFGCTPTPSQIAKRCVATLGREAAFAWGIAAAFDEAWHLRPEGFDYPWLATLPADEMPEDPEAAAVLARARPALVAVYMAADELVPLADQFDMALLFNVYGWHTLTIVQMVMEMVDVGRDFARRNPGVPAKNWPTPADIVHALHLVEGVAEAAGLRDDWPDRDGWKGAPR